MPATSRRVHSSAAAGISPDPAADATPTPEREEERLFRPRAREWGNRFAVRLKANIKWMKRFLHEGK